MFKTFSFKTKNHAELIDITGMVRTAVKDSKVNDGTCLVFVPHTTAGLTVNENADPAVKQDIVAKLEKMIEWNDPEYKHTEKNSAAHIKSSLVGFSHAFIIHNGNLQLGNWQNIYFAEFDGPRSRSVLVHIMGK